jgi:hypothetical protein
MKYNNVSDTVYDFIAASKTFNLSLYDMDITRITKLIDFVGHNLKSNTNYNVLLSYNCKGYGVKGLFFGYTKFLTDDVYNREKIIEFYCKLMAFLIKNTIIDNYRNIEISFYSPVYSNKLQ